MHNPPSPPTINPFIPPKMTFIVPDAAIMFDTEKYNPLAAAPANPPIPMIAIPPKHLNH